MTLSRFVPAMLALTLVGVAPVIANVEPSGHVSMKQEMIQNKPYQIGQVSLNAPPNRVWEIITDYKNATRIFSSLKKCELVEQNGDKHVVSMAARTGVLPLTVNYTLEVTPKGNTRLDWKRVSGAFKKYEGYWNLQATDNGKKTLVTYAKYVEGGAFMPQSMVSRAVRESIPQVLTELKAEAEQRQIALHK